MSDLITLLRARAADHGGDKLLTEAAAALEAAREDGLMHRFADMLLGILNDTQDALGFTDEEKECSNGSADIVAEIEGLRRDAERYRWVRNPLNARVCFWANGDWPPYPSDLDAAIDDAMQATE